jgi:hypothetical protein
VSRWPKRTLEERFWSYVTIGTKDECWLWEGMKQNTGYGRIQTGSYRGILSVHRLSLEWKLGRSIKNGYYACHTCDVKLCVNPNHLWEGTAQQNTEDGVLKGRIKPWSLKGTWANV